MTIVSLLSRAAVLGRHQTSAILLSSAGSRSNISQIPQIRWASSTKTPATTTSSAVVSDTKTEVATAEHHHDDHHGGVQPVPDFMKGHWSEKWSLVEFSEPEPKEILGTYNSKYGPRPVISWDEAKQKGDYQYSVVMTQDGPRPVVTFQGILYDDPYANPAFNRYPKMSPFYRLAPDSIIRWWKIFQGLPVANPPKTFFWQYFGVRPPVPTIPFPDMPADFKEHPDRDLVNYPYPAKTLLPYPTRWVLFPVSWCDAFYPVTGVSGPIVFFSGLFVFLIQKEIIVQSLPFAMVVAWFYHFVTLDKWFGYRITMHGDKVAQDIYSTLRADKHDELKAAVDFRKRSALELTSYSAVRETFPTIFRENIALQLEAAYRANVQKVYTELKRRLDYIRETDEAKRRFEREHMIKWIIDQVNKSITPDVQKSYTTKCIEELKSLSKQTAS